MCRAPIVPCITGALQRGNDAHQAAACCIVANLLLGLPAADAALLVATLHAPVAGSVRANRRKRSDGNSGLDAQSFWELVILKVPDLLYLDRPQARSFQPTCNAHNLAVQSSLHIAGATLLWVA